MNLKQLETFVWVADLGSFRHAAKQLNTTQPNVSARISALENSLGVITMERDAGSVRLTAKGVELLSHARRVLDSVSNLIEAMDTTDLFEGVVRLGVTEMVANTWLNTFLKQFRALYPNTSLELSVDLAANLERELHDYNIDLAFQSGPFTHQTTGCLDLGNFPMIWVASPDNKLTDINQVSAAQLTQNPIITHAKNTVAYSEISNHFAAGPNSSVRLIPSSNLAVSVQMVEDGYGAGALLKPLVDAGINAGRLKKIDYSWVPSKLAFFARYHDNRASAVVRRAAVLGQSISKTFEQEIKES